MQLADFALRLIDVMEEFNRHTVGNEFVLRIGINFGMLDDRTTRKYRGGRVGRQEIGCGAIQPPSITQALWWRA